VKKAFFLLAPTFLCVIIAEYIILPFFIKQHTGISQRELYLLGFVATPHIIVGDTPINAMGFTGDEPALKKAPQTIRILTLGSSAFFNRRMTMRLKDSLAHCTNRHIEILGAALRKHTSASSVYKYRALAKYQFDYVLIYEGINDLWMNHFVLKDFRSDYSHFNPWYARNFILDNSIIARLSYNMMYAILRKFFSPKIVPNGSQFASAYSFRRNMETLIKEIMRHNAVPVLMTQAFYIPNEYTLQKFCLNQLGYNNPDHYDQRPVEAWGDVEYVRAGLKKHNDITRDLAEKCHLRIIDQEKLMGENIFWFGDLCHFSEEGTDRFIQNITDVFRKELSL